VVSGKAACSLAEPTKIYAEVVIPKVMRFGIVVTDPEDWTAIALKAGFEKMGVEAIHLNFSQLAAQIGPDHWIKGNGTNLADLDGLVVRDLGRSGSHDVAFRFETLCALRQIGLSIVNSPEAIQRAANKFATSFALHEAKVPHPQTMVTTSFEAAIRFLEEHGKVVTKPLFGYKGKGLELIVRNEKDRLAEILKRSGVVYLQEFLVSTAPSPRDIRAFVVGGQVAGAIYRVAPEGCWISNLSQGGAPQPCPLNDEIEELALKANQAVGTVYSGVDLMETEDGLKVIEVNGTPSGRGIFQAMDVDVGEMIASYLMDLRS